MWCASPRGGAGGSAAPTRAASTRSSSSGSSSSSHKIELIRIYSNPRAPARPESSSTGGASSSWSAAAAVGVAPPQPRVPKPLEQNRGLRALAEVEQDRTGLIQQLSWREEGRRSQSQLSPTVPMTISGSSSRRGFRCGGYMRS